MEKLIADTLALKLAAKIILTEPKIVINNHSPDAAANSLADFVKTLSERFQKDLDSRVSSGCLDKS
ncbi:hypothetical protein [Orbus mooreae]|uniref:hypothetical protein n=1 Tax=Orbus mooreae TaxID=3074107 RepID=UPI00370D4C9A